jgi:hypothetical protein
MGFGKGFQATQRAKGPPLWIVDGVATQWRLAEAAPGRPTGGRNLTVKLIGLHYLFL